MLYGGAFVPNNAKQHGVRNFDDATATAVTPQRDRDID